MLDFQAIKTTLEQANLSPEEWEQVAMLVSQHRQSDLPKPSTTEVQEWMASLNAAINAFWEGVSPEEKAELLAAWNQTGDESDDESHLFDWIDDIPENKR